ncbi:TTAGGG repeat binding factor [Orbilia ellipsospora]|uniref:TTAGGG repeat binding factor n=1 Tax=Orbilia ellipsospora TaxID=2528407 RepID=A0AAV9XMI9_9PEZI
MEALTATTPLSSLMDHSDLSAIAAFNKAHDESQKASQLPASSEKPEQTKVPIQQVSKPEPMKVDPKPVAPTVASAPKVAPAPRTAAPLVTQSSTNAQRNVAPPSTAGVKRPAEESTESLEASTKRQSIGPRPRSQTPQAQAQVQTIEQSVASQTSPVTIAKPRPEEPIVRNPVDDYGSDSDDDYEKHPPEDTLPGASGYSFSNAFANGQLLDPSQHLRIQSLPILDNLSSQLLGTLFQGQFQDTLVTVTQPDTDQGQAYATLKALFWQTKRLYSSDAFLSTDELKFQVPEHRNMIRQVNLATFVTSLFGSTEVGFFHLNQYFLSTFVPEGGRLLKLQGNLYLGLKTQAYISAIDTGEKTKEQILDDLFEPDMATKLADRRGGSKELIPSETDFISRVKNRREQLEKAPTNVPILREIYPWQDWLREMIQYVAKHRDSILAPTTRKKLKRLEAAQGDSNKHMFQAHSQASSSMYGQHSALYPPPPGMSQPVYPGYSSVGRPSMHASYSGHQAAPGLTQTSLSGSAPNPALSVGTSPTTPQPHEQTTPTHILYEQARLAATARQSPNARRAGLPSQRRPWSTEEEHALMLGLDYVKGPHWSQILAMFGAGGTINEALKDRNQVQLKDKARNLKLFFLKSGMDVPYYLQFVTGELKTRAPGQVAKNEKRKQQEEEANQNRATVDALNVLVGGASNGESSQAALARAQAQQSQPALQPPRPQPTHVPTANHPQRWAMSQNQPQPHAHPSATAPKAEPKLEAHPSMVTNSNVQKQAVQNTQAVQRTQAVESVQPQTARQPQTQQPPPPQTAPANTVQQPTSIPQSSNAPNAAIPPQTAQPVATSNV